MPKEMDEGWGLVKRFNKGELEFYASDSSDVLFVVDPYTW